MVMDKTLEQELKPWHFARVVSDKKLKGSGLSRGDEVFIMSTKDVAFKRNDPYLLRRLMIVATIVGGKVIIPSDKNEAMAVVVDPRSLEYVGKERNEELLRLLKEQYEG